MDDNEQPNFDLTIAEYCARKSKTDRRVELLGAFHHVEKQAGRIKDSESAYDRRYADFAIQPA